MPGSSALARGFFLQTSFMWERSKRLSLNHFCVFFHLQLEQILNDTLYFLKIISVEFVFLCGDLYSICPIDIFIREILWPPFFFFFFFLFSLSGIFLIVVGILFLSLSIWGLGYFSMLRAPSFFLPRVKPPFCKLLVWSEKIDPEGLTLLGDLLSWQAQLETGCAEVRTWQNREKRKF